MNVRTTFVILASSDMQATFRLSIWQFGIGFLHRRIARRLRSVWTFSGLKPR